MTLKTIKTSSHTFSRSKVKRRNSSRSIDNNSIPKNLKKVRDKALPILKRQGVTKAAVFGSCARGDNKKTSDIDFLVKVPRNTSLMDLAGLKLELEDKFGRKVDIITYNSVHHLLKKSILEDEKIIYEKRH